MAVDTELKSADNPLAPDFSNVVAILGPSELGTVGEVYQLSPGQEPYDTLGAGWLSEDAAAALAEGATVVAVPVAKTAGSVGAVVHRNPTDTGAGTGPAITVTAPGGGPLLDLPLFKAKIKAGGDRDAGAAIVSIAYDGSTIADDIAIPPAPQAAVIGTIDVTALNLATLDTETLKITPDDHAQITVTFAAPATVQAVFDQINAQLAAGGSAARAVLYQGRYVKIYSATHGAASTLVIDATSTADGTLGLSNAPAAGSDATITLPYTGLVLTFASGNYVVGETYAAAVVGPSCSQAAYITAAQALRANGAPFGLGAICQPAADGAAVAALQDALDLEVGSWEGGAESIWEEFLIAGPLGATGAAGITANDLDVKAGCLGHTSRRVTIVHGDAYVPGHRVQGEHRRSFCRPIMVRAATQSLSQDVGFGQLGPLPGCSLVGPDKTTATGAPKAGTKARNEATATIKMGGSSGPGFTVATTKRGNAFAVHGVTRAGSASQFVHLGVVRMIYRVAQVAFVYLQTYENWTPLLKGDGTLRDSDADALTEALDDLLRQAVIKPPESHASDLVVTVDRAEVVANTNNVTVGVLVQRKGQAENIKLTITATGILTVLAA
jgi:hypothetical protein